MSETIDKKDRQILNMLQSDGRASLAVLGRRAGLAPSAVHHRLKRLQAQGCVRGFVALLDPARLGFTVTALVTVRTGESPSSRDVGAALTAIDQVLEVHDVAGEACYVLKVLARDIHDLKQVVRERIGVIRGVQRTSTTVVLETLKQTHAVALGCDAREQETA
jgi:Lrp/AsnC family leucine-responsive transcriptional regulator